MIGKQPPCTNENYPKNVGIVFVFLLRSNKAQEKIRENYPLNIPLVTPLIVWEKRLTILETK